MVQRAFLKIQCREPKSSQIGDFICDIETGEAVSPVFADLALMFDWFRENGWIQQPHDSKHPCGVYAKSADNYEITVCRFDRITKTHTTHGTRPHPGGHYRLKDDEICHSRGEYVDVLTNPGSWTVRKHS